MWEAIFFLLILKIPIIYLGWVVWWAIKAEPKPDEGAAITAQLGDIEPRPPWHRRLLHPRGPRGGPHGTPRRRYARTALASARAEVER